MKKLLLIALLSFAGLSLQAQNLTIRNNTACPVNVYAFAATVSCAAWAGGSYCPLSPGAPYIAGAYSVAVFPLPRGCNLWDYAVLNTSPNPNGWADGCVVGNAHPGGTGTPCVPTPTGSFYVVSCGSFVNVNWQPNVPSPGDVTIDIN